MRKAIFCEKIINAESKAPIETKLPKPKPLSRVKKAPPKLDPGTELKYLQHVLEKATPKGNLSGPGGRSKA
jgi:hypothetical protein